MKELMNRIWKKEEGFSLIELIIVIAILAIIAAIAVPNLLGNIQKANKTTDESNAKMIADSIAMVVAENPAFDGVAIAQQIFITGNSATGSNIVEAALVKINDVQPLVKSSTYGTVGGGFQVVMTTAGVITVFGTDGTTEAFPQSQP